MFNPLGTLSNIGKAGLVTANIVCFSHYPLARMHDMCADIEILRGIYPDSNWQLYQPQLLNICTGIVTHSEDNEVKVVFDV